MESSVVRLGLNGRLVIPAHIRKSLSLDAGDQLLLTVKDGEVIIRTPAEAVSRAQEIVGRHLPSGHSLSEELMADRRREEEQDA